MRTLSLAVLAVIPALALGACAGSGYEHSTAAAAGDHDQARLERECHARGGILVPTGHLSAEPALDNYCDVTNSTNPTPIPAP